MSYKVGGMELLEKLEKNVKKLEEHTELHAAVVKRHYSATGLQQCIHVYIQNKVHFLSHACAFLQFCVSMSPIYRFLWAELHNLNPNWEREPEGGKHYKKYYEIKDFLPLAHILDKSRTYWK